MSQGLQSHLSPNAFQGSRPHQAPALFFGFSLPPVHLRESSPTPSDSEPATAQRPNIPQPLGSKGIRMLAAEAPQQGAVEVFHRQPLFCKSTQLGPVEASWIIENPRAIHDRLRRDSETTPGIQAVSHHDDWHVRTDGQPERDASSAHCSFCAGRRE